MARFRPPRVDHRRSNQTTRSFRTKSGLKVAASKTFNQNGNLQAVQPDLAHFQPPRASGERSGQHNKMTTFPFQGRANFAEKLRKRVLDKFGETPRKL
eukprot:2708934-Alexandrium_andersonii.AAC.1